MNKFLIVGLLLSLSTAVSAKTYVLGVVPQHSSTTLYKMWKPITDYLSKTTGFNIVFQTEKSLTTFEKKLSRQTYDFSYMSPHQYANNSDSSLPVYYVAALRSIKPIRGVLVAKEEAFEKALTQNPIYLFPSPTAFAATRLMAYELSTSFGVQMSEQRVRYVNSHDSVYKGIERDFGQLGGGVERTLSNYKRAHPKSKIKVVYRTKSYPSHPIAFKSTLPAEDVKSITHAFLSMPLKLLRSLSIPELIETNDAEYERVRAFIKSSLNQVEVK